jgi:hypothetical protein
MTAHNLCLHCTRQTFALYEEYAELPHSIYIKESINSDLNKIRRAFEQEEYWLTKLTPNLSIFGRRKKYF